MLWLRAFLVLLCLAAAPFGPSAGFIAAAAAQDISVPDYKEWDKVAAEAAQILTDDRASNEALESLRARIVKWRTDLTAAQGLNSGDIDTLKGQIAALGPVPADGAAEDRAIAERRAALTQKLTQLQAPGLAAVEARSQADGLVRQIDTRIRERQAKELLRLSPSPVNPVNWPAGWAVFSQGMKTLVAEVTEAWSNPARQSELKNNLPAIIFYLFAAAILVLRGPVFTERLTTRLLTGASLRARNIAAAVVSLGQFLVPLLGTVFLVLAIQSSGMTGPRSGALIEALPVAAFFLFTFRWLASWLFRAEGNFDTLTEHAAEARFHVRMIGVVYAVEIFRRAFITEVRPPLSMAAQAVVAAPLVFVLAVFLFRLSQLIAPREAKPMSGATEFRSSLMRLIGLGSLAVSLVAPALAAIGYVAAANALIWPTVTSLGLLGLILLIQRFATDIYVLAGQRGEEGRETLFPVMTGLVLMLGSIPLFALIWGARVVDLSETWTRIGAGIPIGQTRLSPAVILTFLLVFTIGYMITRLLQRMLKTTLLPRTTLEKGVQNAVVSGLGYIGIILAGLVAITTAGIDLSALAIVAGALSVGIGFGLQNIVQNFVSGIILLIERPISEGDMIEVNGQFGIVKGISVRSTWIETFDRTDVIVPNADLVSGVVTNLTRGNLTGRLIIPVGVAYGSDTRKVAAILTEIAEAQPLVLVNPPPSIVFSGLGADSLNFEIRTILSDVNYKLAVQTDILHQVVERFAAEGIEIPFTQRDIWIRNAEDLQPRGARRAAKPKAMPDLPVAQPDPGTINNDPVADEIQEDGDRR
ncbi:MAG: mechanosensitive ion channel family protein [Rhodobacteraceae bacterium]|nr:mechanosensitive ion channel family protein [Paracoccaceae bacterium]